VKEDKLEKYIINKSEDFNDLTPDPKIWEKITDDLDMDGEKVRRFTPGKILWRVAAVIIIFIASYFFHDMMSKRDRIQIADQEGIETPGSNEVLKMLEEAEAYYTARITTMQEEVYRFAASNPEIREEINLELSQLDSIYAELKKDLKDNAANEQVVEAMIQNYRIKLEILEDILNQLRKTEKNENTETHEI